MSLVFTQFFTLSERDQIEKILLDFFFQKINIEKMHFKLWSVNQKSVDSTHFDGE